MQSYIIYNSPDSGTEHKAKQLKQQLKTFGFDVELFDGIWHTDSEEFCSERGIELYSEWIKNSKHHIAKGVRLIEKFIRTSSTPQNKGCFASHFLLWQKCVSCNQAVCIFEYDAIVKSKLPDNILELFDEAIEICISPIHDEGFKINEDVSFKDYSSIDFPEPGFARGNSTGYVIKPEGARNLIRISEEKGYF